MQTSRRVDRKAADRMPVNIRAKSALHAQNWSSAVQRAQEPAAQQGRTETDVERVKQLA